VSRGCLFATSLSLVAASLALAACGSESPSAALRNWAANANLTRNSAQLTLDARHVLSALNDVHSTGAQLRTVCGVLDLETLQANSALPTPDAQTTSLLSTAYTDLGDGANECYVALGSVAKRDRAVAFLQRAGAKLSQAQVRVSTLVSS
jgi:hypothetical protein